MPPREHELKCAPQFFTPLLSGEKTCELRFDDRAFRAGDTLWLREWQPSGYTGREIRAEVTYLLCGLPWLQPGYVCMSIRPLGRGPEEEV